MAQHPHHPRVPPLMPTPQSGMMTDPHHHGAPPLMPTPNMSPHSLLQTPGNLTNIPPPLYNHPHLLPQPTGILNPPHLPYNRGRGFGHPPRGNPGNYNPSWYGYHSPQPQGGQAPYFVPQNRRRGQGRYFNERRSYQRGAKYRKYDDGGNNRGRWGGASDTNSEQYYNNSMFEDPWAELMKSACAAVGIVDSGPTIQSECTSTIDSEMCKEDIPLQSADWNVATCSSSSSNTEEKLEDSGVISQDS